MKSVREPVDVIAVFHREGYPTPYKMRYEDRAGNQLTMKIDSVCGVDEEFSFGQKQYLYTCQSTVGDWTRKFELRYFLRDAKWELMKI